MEYRAKSTTLYASPDKASTTSTYKSRAEIFFYLLREEGSFLLKEDSGKIVLNDAIFDNYSFVTKH